MKTSELRAILPGLIQQYLVPCLYGGPGTGKSAFLIDLFTKLDYEVVISHPAISEPTDYKGLPCATGNGHAEFLPYGDLRKLIEAEKPTVVFLDDLGQAPHAVQAALMQIIHAREIEGHKISDHVYFVAASNRDGDRAFVQRMITPLAGRLLHFDFDVDVEEWIELALGLDFHPTVIAHQRFAPDGLNVFEPTKSSEKAFPSCRSWEYVSTAMKSLNGSILESGAETELYKGIIGSEWAARLMGVVEIERQCDMPDTIIAKPKTARIPDKPEAQYAIGSALAARASVENFAAISTYLKRWPDTAAEIGAVTVQDSYVRCREIAETPEFVEWSIANHDIVCV